MYYRVPLNRACFCRISSCEQPSSMSQIITNLNKLLILFRTTRGAEPDPFATANAIQVAKPIFQLCLMCNPLWLTECPLSMILLLLLMLSKLE
jgi:hypothetical protein